MDPFITCKELIEFLADYLDGELPAPERREFDRHLAVCPSCVNYLETYKGTIALGRAALCDPDEAPPKEVPEDLIKAILATRKRPAT